MSQDRAFCSKCGTARGVGAFCSACGTAYAAPVAPEPTGWVQRAAPKSGGGKPMLGRLFLVVVLVVGAGAIAAVGNAPRAAAPRPTTQPVVTWSPPEGFQKTSQDPSVAFRWVDRTTCDTGDSCWGMEIVAHDGCPDGLYVELSILDSSGAAIGFTNDTVGAIQRGGRARLTFDTYEDAADKARLTEVSCR